MGLVQTGTLHQLDVDAVEYAQPLRETAVVRLVLFPKELGDFDKRERFLVVEHLVLFVLVADAVAVVGGFGGTVEHLEADEVQVAKIVAADNKGNISLEIAITLIILILIELEKN